MISVQCTLCTPGLLWDEVMSNSEKIKPIALSIVKLCLAESIS